MHVTELYRRILTHAETAALAPLMRARMLRAGHVFCTVDEQDRVLVWTVSDTGVPVQLSVDR